MINKFDLSKALFDHAKSIAVANSLKLVPDGEEYETKPDETYLREFVLFGKDDSIGLSDNSKDIQFGIYQINIYIPKIFEGSKWLALKTSEYFQSGFKKGTTLTRNNQSVRMKNSYLNRLDPERDHFVYALSIQYSIIN